MKILIVDDEKISRDSLEWMILQEWDDELSVETARSGLEGIDKARDNPPDILLMDIRMPGISGLDAAKEILRIQPDITILFISAHEDFQYARQALQMGAVNYINKPVDRREFLGVLRETMGRLAREREEKQRILKIRNEYFLTRPILEQNLIYGILLTNELPGPELLEFGELRELLSSGGRIVTVQSLPRAEGLPEGQDSSLLRFKERMKGSFDCLLGPVILNSITGLVFDTVPPAGEESPFRKSFSVFWEELGADLTLSLRAGIGAYAHMDEFPDSYNQSLQALSRTETGEFRFLEGEPVSQQVQEAELPRILGAPGSSSDLLLDVLRKQGHSVARIRNHLAEESAVSVVKLRRQGVPKNLWLGSGEYLTALLQRDDWKGILEWIRTFRSALTGEIKSSSSFMPFLDKAISILDEEYSSPELSLESVADRCSVNPAYLSLRFREHFDINFMQYLTNKRLDKACRLLKDRNLSVKEISFRIGYRDPNYFSRLFRNSYGMPPSDFRKKG